MTDSPATDAGPESRSLKEELLLLAKLSLPIAAAQAGNAAMSLEDVAIVGRAGNALAALSVANGIFFAVSVFGMGLLLGLDPLTSQAVGRNDHVRGRVLIWQGFWLSLFATLVLGTVLLATPWVLAAFDLQPATREAAARCVALRSIGLPAFLCFIGQRAYLQARSVTAPMLWSTVAANLFNIGAGIVAVHGGAVLPEAFGPLRALPAFGAEGAALVSGLASWLQLGVVGMAILRLHRGTPPVPRAPVVADLKLAAGVGLPIGLQMGAEVGVFALATLLAGKLGDDAVSAHQLALSLASFSFCLAIGVGSAGSVRVGWAVGRGDREAVKRAGSAAFLGGVLVMGASALLFLAIPELLARALTDSPAVVAVAVPLLGVAAAFQLADGIQGVGAGVLRGTGDTRFAFVANVAGHYLVGLPIALWLGFARGGGIIGIWWGLGAGLFAVAAALLVRFFQLADRPIARLEPVSQPATAPSAG